jgi:threonine synthase
MNQHFLSSPAYLSTRGEAGRADFSEALLSGLAPDGGLYVPETLYPFDEGVSFSENYADAVQSLLTRYGALSLGDEALKAAGLATQNAFLGVANCVPLRQIDDGLYLLNLWQGPTLAFKDMAMQMIAPLTEAALARSGQNLTLVTATSGDTGAAAVRAFAGCAGIDLIVFHPLGRVSEIQRRQMTCERAPNIKCVAIEGDFDDCQRLVKSILKQGSEKGQTKMVSSVNSINWGRLLGQVPYYQAALEALGGQVHDVVVPTGNFGDALAGWVARAMGSPIGDICAAVNQNDALNQLWQTGRYARRSAKISHSVSMDVQAPSNFERHLYWSSGGDGALTGDLMRRFEREGEVEIPQSLLVPMKSGLDVGMVTEDQTIETMSHAYKNYGIEICPHTAVALHVSLKRKSEGHNRPQLILSTAHAAKFASSVGQALGHDPIMPESLKGLLTQDEDFIIMQADEGAALKLVFGK